MIAFEEAKLNASRDLIYSEGSLLERTIFRYFFEDGSKESCIRSLLAYQNEDGGFGHGIERDLSTPSSSGIGAETALYYLDMLDYTQGEILTKLSSWLAKNTNDMGYIPHPPADFMKYPHQSWWENADRERIFSVSGLIKKLGNGIGSVEKRILAFANTYELPSTIEFYDYPYFIYALYSKEINRRQETINKYVNGFESFITKNASHHPLFSRYWYHAIPLLPVEIVLKCATGFIESIQDNGGIINPYPQHPKWCPIFTLDGLILIKKYALNLSA